jgi:hypothetical protein
MATDTVMLISGIWLLVAYSIVCWRHVQLEPYNDALLWPLVLILNTLRFLYRLIAEK